MRKLIKVFWRTRRSAAAVEFALVTTFLLLPIFIGASDFVVIITAQAQLNTAMQAIDYFAVTNPTAASGTTGTTNVGYILALINTNSVYHVTLPANETTSLGTYSNGSVSYGCFLPPATSTTTPTYQTATCPSTDTQQTFVTYEVTTRVILPVPLPGLASPFTMNATSTIQTQ
jgi:Flp pilus assembly protein TadG